MAQVYDKRGVGSPRAGIELFLFKQASVAWHAVPSTWNDQVLHAHGRLRAIEDPDWILALLRRQSAVHEAGEAQPWSPAEAPPDYIAKMLKAIVGIEIVIERLDGKFKGD